MHSDDSPVSLEKCVALMLERQERMMCEMSELKKGLGVIRRSLEKALPVLSAFQNGEDLEQQWKADRQDRMDKALRYLEKRSARQARARSSHP